MKHRLLPLTFVVLICSSIFAQNDCPNIPVYSFFEAETFISSSTPDDPSKGTGLWLPEGDVVRGADVRPMYIPDNRPTWAISLAHAWNYSRNVLGEVEHPKLSYLMATVTQESEWACDKSAQWGVNVGHPLGYPFPDLADGCFQIEGPSSAFLFLGDIYPYRFQNSHDDLISEDNFETSALAKVYYDLIASRAGQYRLGWEFEESIAATLDPYAFEKSISSWFNGGSYAFASNASFYNGSQDGNSYWSGLAATTSGYPEKIADNVSVLEDNSGYATATGISAGSTFNGYYNELIYWSDFEAYLDTIQDFYHEIDMNAVKLAVKPVFVDIAGDEVTGVPFTQLGDVIDEIILQLPKEDPMQRALATESIIGTVGCSGDDVPYGYISMLNGGDTIFLGQSIQFFAEGQLFADDLTYSWDEAVVVNKNGVQGKPGVIVSTDREYIATPTSTGDFEYELTICDGPDCFTAAPVVIHVESAPCSLTATTSNVLNEVCSGSVDGQFKVNMTNQTSIYTIVVDGPTAFEREDVASNATYVTYLSAGFYSVEVHDQDEPSCIAYTSATVGLDTLIHEKLEVSILDSSSCDFEVIAELVPADVNCNYTLHAYQVNGGMPMPNWEPSVLLGVSYPDIKLIQGVTDEDYEWGPNSWDIADYSIASIDVMQGDEINLSFFNTTFTTSIASYNVDVLDANGAEVASYQLPAGLAANSQGAVGVFTASCVDVVTPYAFAWEPTSNVLQTEDTFETVVLAVSDTDDEFYVAIASNSAVNHCSLYTEIEIKMDPTCVQTGKSNLVNMDVVSVYPNPVSSVLEVTLDEELMKLELIDQSGIVVLNSTNHYVDVEGLSSGVYVLKVYTEEHVYTSRIVKE